MVSSGSDDCKVKRQTLPWKRTSASSDVNCDSKDATSAVCGDQGATAAPSVSCIDCIRKNPIVTKCSSAVLWLVANLIVLAIVFPHIIFGYIPVAISLAFQDVTEAVQRAIAKGRKKGGGSLCASVSDTASLLIEDVVKPSWLFAVRVTAPVRSFYSKLRAFILSGGSSIDDCNALGVTFTRYCFCGAPQPFTIAKEETPFAEAFLPTWALLFGKVIRAVGSIRVFDTWLLRYMVPYIGRVNLIDFYFADYTVEEDVNIRQIVLLGAGYDTRAYRFAEERYNPAGDELTYPTKVLEVDLPKVQERKLQVLRKHFSEKEFEKMTRYVEFIPCILGDDEALYQTLAKSQIDPTRNTLVIMEGVSPYLPENAFKKTIHTLRRFFTPDKVPQGANTATDDDSKTSHDNPKHLLLFDTMTTEPMAKCKSDWFFNWDRVMTTYGVGPVETTLSGRKEKLAKELEALGLRFKAQHLWKDLIQVALKAENRVKELQMLLDTRMPFVLDQGISMVQYILAEILPLEQKS